MPNYDYNCNGCKLTFEIRHSMTETPTVICPKCQSRSTSKIPSLVGIVSRSGRSVAMDRAHDQVKRNIEMKEDMRRNMGIEQIHPLRNSTMKQVYDDAKAQKSEIKESMAAQAESRAKERTVKQREWTKAALLRTPQRRKDMAERKAKEAAVKRAIKL
jgi:putative FmdB family regulatory protein